MDGNRRVCLTDDDATYGGAQHTSPCSDCPWRRDSLAGWLGGNTADEWVAMAHADVHIPCHTRPDHQCAGNAIYRRNACKSVRPPLLTLERDTDKVFNWPNEFLAHHNRMKT